MSSHDSVQPVVCSISFVGCRVDADLFTCVTLIVLDKFETSVTSVRW